MSFSKYTALTANEVLGEFNTFLDSGLKTSDIKVLSNLTKLDGGISYLDSLNQPLYIFLL